MKIVADAGLARIEEEFSGYGELVLKGGREITQSDLIDAEILLVRSITRVDSDLLSNTAVKVVGTATSGTDHIDREYLAKQGVRLLDSKGSNANAVAEYCLAALAWYRLQCQQLPAAFCVGIVGAGCTGSALAEKLRALKIDYLLCDPPLASLAEGSTSLYSSMNEISRCQVVSLHVPLSKTGEHKTENLIDREFLDKMNPEALLINSCRGGVVDESALAQRLSKESVLHTVMDVWEGEPDVDRELASRVDITTPHIAGYSIEAKQAATSMLRQSLFKDIEVPGPSSESPAQENCRIDCSDLVGQDKHWQAISRAVGLEPLSAEFKASLSEGDRASAFDAFRQRLKGRREFSGTVLSGGEFNERESKALQQLGFLLQ